MKYLFRYLLAGLLIFALLLTILWIRSYYIYDSFHMTSPFVMVTLESNYSRLYFYSETLAPRYGKYPWSFAFASEPAQDYWRDPPLLFENIIGFEMVIAYWIVIAAICVVFAVRHMWRNSIVAIPGICPECSYDMRATPDQCPECGHKTK